jgi:hypothetical protein
MEPVTAGTEDSKMALIGSPSCPAALPRGPCAAPLLELWLSAVPCSILLMMMVVQGWKLKKDMPVGAY